MPDHSRHRAAAGEEMPVAEGVAGHYAVGGDQRIGSDPLDETEQLRPIDHLDLLQLISGDVEDVRSLPDVVVIEQVLEGGKVLRRIWAGAGGNESRFDRVERLEVGNLNQNPTDLGVVLVTHGDLAHPVF